jgi:hypothetical protein
MSHTESGLLSSSTTFPRSTPSLSASWTLWGSKLPSVEPAKVEGSSTVALMTKGNLATLEVILRS